MSIHEPMDSGPSADVLSSSTVPEYPNPARKCLLNASTTLFMSWQPFPTRLSILVTLVYFGVSLGSVGVSTAQTAPNAWWPTNGAHVSQRPPFRFYGVPGATAYNLRIVDSADEVVVYAWFTPSQTACESDNNCALTSPLSLSNGSYNWAVRSWSTSAGYSSYTPLTTLVATSSQEKYLERVQSDQTGFPELSGAQHQIVNWMRQYLAPDAPAITRFNFPHLLGAAMHQMYMGATVHVTDLFRPDQPYIFFDVVMGNPDRPVWANCGDSVIFMMQALDEFGIAARQVSMWSSLDDAHDVVEYYSEAFKKTVYYDPLYGALLLDDAGEPASIENILEQVNEAGKNANGLDYAQWNLSPVRFTSWSRSDDANPAADSRFEYYRGLNYSWGILRSYPTVMARRYEDTSSLQITLPGEDVVFGKWLVFDNSVSSPYRDYFLVTFWPTFYQRFDAKQNGRYRLLVVKSTAR